MAEQHLAANSMLGEIMKYTTPIVETVKVARDNNGHPTTNFEGSDSTVILSNGKQAKPWERVQATVPLNKAIYYRMDEGIGSVIKDSVGGGPDIAITGDTSKIWNNPGWLTFGVGGNPMQAAGDPYVDSLFNLSSLSGSLIFAFDYKLEGWPTASESIFSIGTPTGAAGGIRVVASAFTVNSVGTYITPVGGGELLTVLGTGETPGVKRSAVIDIDFSKLATDGKIHATYYLDGMPIRCNTSSISALPAMSSTSGLVIGAHWSPGFLNKLGTGTEGSTRLANFFAMRCERRDARTAQYLAQHMADRTDSSLPTGIRSV